MEIQREFGPYREGLRGDVMPGRQWETLPLQVLRTEVYKNKLISLDVALQRQARLQFFSMTFTAVELRQMLAQLEPAVQAPTKAAAPVDPVSLSPTPQTISQAIHHGDTLIRPAF